MDTMAVVGKETWLGVCPDSLSTWPSCKCTGSSRWCQRRWSESGSALTKRFSAGWASKITIFLSGDAWRQRSKTDQQNGNPTPQENAMFRNVRVVRHHTNSRCLFDLCQFPIDLAFDGSTTLPAPAQAAHLRRSAECATVQTQRWPRFKNMLLGCPSGARGKFTPNGPDPQPAAAGLETEDWDLLFRAVLETLARTACGRAPSDGAVSLLQTPGDVLDGCLDALEQLRRSAPSVQHPLMPKGGAPGTSGAT